MLICGSLEQHEVRDRGGGRESVLTFHPHIWHSLERRHNNRHIHAHISLSAPPPLSVSHSHRPLFYILNCTTVEWLWIQLYHGTNIKLSKSIDLSFSLKSALVKRCLIKAGFTEFSWVTTTAKRKGGNVLLDLRFSVITSTRARLKVFQYFSFWQTCEDLLGFSAFITCSSFPGGYRLRIRSLSHL